MVRFNLDEKFFFLHRDKLDLTVFRCDTVALGFKTQNKQKTAHTTKY